MSYRWGATDVPELLYRPMGLRDRPVPGDLRGLTHIPTGIRMTSTNSLRETRGEERDFLFLGPPDEGWVARVTSGREAPGFTGRLLGHLGMRWSDFVALPANARQAMEADFLRSEGDRFECLSVRREGDSPTVVWSAERRDALVLMILFFEEMGRHDVGPFPSTLALRAPDIPEDLRGTFRNPVWERLQ